MGRVEADADVNSQRILLVDDEETIAFSIGRFLGLRGLAVDCAHELEEAQALLANVRYAVVIADLRLTGVHGAEGLEVLAYVRQHCPGTRTILLTAYGSAAVEGEAAERGADLVLHKPVPLPALARMVTLLAGLTA